MTERSAPTTQESTALQRISMDPQALIRAAVEQKADVETLERLFALAKELRAEQARDAYYQAMAQFQQRCGPVFKTKTARISTRSGGSYSFTFAPLSEIMGTIQPEMGPLGLSVSFRVKQETERVLASARITHEMGHHEESGDVAVAIQKETADGAGAMGANAAQRIGIAHSYAKRYALLAILGLAPVEEDHDGGGQPPVQEPRRTTDASAPAPTAPAPAPARNGDARTGEVQLWSGKIMNTKIRSGKKSNGEPWTLYIIQTADAQEFSTFKAEHYEFARAAGSGRVTIEWVNEKVGDKTYQRVVSIGPDEGEGA